MSTSPICDTSEEDVYILPTSFFQESLWSLDLFPEPLFPTFEALRHEWEGLFFWVFSEYEPGIYPGKSTFFFTKSKQELGEDVKWHKVAEAKDKEVEVHHLAGRHDTCKTIHLQDLTEHLRMCLDKVQAAESRRSDALLR